MRPGTSPAEFLSATPACGRLSLGPDQRADVEYLNALMRHFSLPALPIAEALPQLANALARRSRVLLEAPPGAGKSTVVPLALLDSAWLRERKILMLEPRRIAAPAPARGMGGLPGGAGGKTAGT